MRKSSRLFLATFLVVAGAFGLAGLLAPVVSAAPGCGSGQFCGGIQGLICPPGFVCKDIPGDGCNPQQGGADCLGCCKRAH